MTESYIIDTVCEVLKLNIKDVLTKKKGCKVPEYCDARCIIIYLIKQLPDKPYTNVQIGNLMGRNNHSFAIYSNKKAEQFIQIKDKQFTAKLAKVVEAMK